MLIWFRQQQSDVAKGETWSWFSFPPTPGCLYHLREVGEREELHF